MLAVAGWYTPDLDFETEFEVGSIGEPDGLTDYALPGTDGKYLAVVEAKRTRPSLGGR